MAGDAFKKVRAGQPLEVPAATFNAFVDAAIAHKRGDSGAGPLPPDQRSSTIVPIRNSSGSDRPRGAVLGIAGPLIGPADNVDEFLNRIALEGTAPTLAHIARWAVLAEPLAVGRIGRAIVSGLAVCLVEIRHVKHQYLEVNASGTLESGDSGSARIVWAETGTGTKWAVINIDSPRSLQAKCELIDDLEEGGVASAWLLYQDNLGNWRRVTPNVTLSVNAGDYSVENPPNDDRSGSSFTGVKFGGADANNSGDVVDAVGWIEGSTLRWFAIGSGHKVVTGTVASDVPKGTLAPLSVDLRAVDGRNVSVSATALTDLKAGANVIAWWNGPVRRWEMTDPSRLTYQAGCGITIDPQTDPQTIAVDSLSLVGPGLAPVGTCGLSVVPGCGIQVGTDVAVDPFALAGAGLVPGAGCSLSVNPGCGIQINGGQVQVVPSALAGQGLLAGGGFCDLKVDLGCGLEFSGNAIKLQPQAIAGAGLEGDLFQPGECMIQVDFAPNCGLAIDTNDKLTVDMTTLAGPGLIEWTNPWGCVGLQVDCDHIKNSCLGGFSGTKNVVTDITCDPYDPYACPVAVIEQWTFAGGLLMSAQ